MKILVFSPDTPFPPNRGGRADIWRRIEAFVHLGHSVMLVHLTDPNNADSINDDNLREIESVVDVRASFSIRRSFFLTLKQLVISPIIPWHISTRIPDLINRNKIEDLIESFRPDVVWLDGPWFGFLAKRVVANLGIPLLYRSHNIEHIYLRGQARVAVRMRDRIAWMLACVGLKRYEFKLIDSASIVFDISVEDMKYWTSSGFDHIRWLPPLPLVEQSNLSIVPVFSDILFTGNLSTPNNVRGVEWLITKVLPLVLKECPNVKIHIVGSNPTDYILDLLRSAENVVASFNVSDIRPYLFGAKVLVNPVSTGSGVQVKMLDMLMTDAPIVTTSQGVFGLPTEFRNLFNIADEAGKFSKFLVDQYRVSTVNLNERNAARSKFSIDAVQRALTNL